MGGLPVVGVHWGCSTWLCSLHEIPYSAHTCSLSSCGKVTVSFPHHWPSLRRSLGLHALPNARPTWKPAGGGKGSHPSYLVRPPDLGAHTHTYWPSIERKNAEEMLLQFLNPAPDLTPGPLQRCWTCQAQDTSRKGRGTSCVLEMHGPRPPPKATVI